MISFPNSLSLNVLPDEGKITYSRCLPVDNVTYHQNSCGDSPERAELLLYDSTYYHYFAIIDYSHFKLGKEYHRNKKYESNKTKIT